MKVILLQKVAGLGNIEDIKDVADGYAMNFLFPRHLAVQASNKEVTTLAAKQKKRVKDAEAELQEAQKIAGRLDGLELDIKEKASERGQLYAAVNALKISQLLLTKGFKIAPEQIVIKEPIKEAGNFEVKVKFRHGLEANVVVVVTAKSGD